MKSFEELTFRDNFMFNAVMRDPGLCREVLETLLQSPVGELSVPDYEKNIKVTKDGKAIRLDIFVKEQGVGTVYNAEMQNLNKQSVENLALGKRTRYYQALIDSSILSENEDYRFLTDTNIVVVCTFDPFGLGLPRYCFQETCEEKPGFKLGSGTCKIFINTTSDAVNLTSGVRNLYNYINTGRVSDDLTDKIESAVELARMDKEMRAVFMKNTLFYQDAKYEGKMEGQEEVTRKMIVKLINRQMSVEEIAELCEVTPEYVKELMTETE